MQRSVSWCLCSQSKMFFNWQVLSLCHVFLFYLNLDAIGSEELLTVVDKTSCSVTCGMGIQTQTLCYVEEGKKTVDEEPKRCHVRKAACREMFNCGLRTMTVTSGGRVDIDCVGEVSELITDLSWRDQWGYARGVVTFDDSLFAHWNASQMARLILDPVSEADAGTYRCVMLNSESKMVKRIYWGIRVVSNDFISLDYKRALAQWESSPAPDGPEKMMKKVYVVLISFGIAVVLVALTLVIVYGVQRPQDNAGPNPPATNEPPQAAAVI